jgi:type IV secretory pathway VirB2 component (pilin)
MVVFVIAAVVMALIHLVAACQRPRLAVIVSGLLWLLYAAYEHQVATGVLCDSDCNIRVDLVLFLPVLALATLCAYRSYLGRLGRAAVIGTVLGLIGLFVLGPLAGVLAIILFVIMRKVRTNPS